LLDGHSDKLLVLEGFAERKGSLRPHKRMAPARMLSYSAASSAA
jgi:hypothetical protein